MKYAVCKPPAEQPKPLSAGQIKRGESKRNNQVRKVVKWASAEMSVGM